MLHLLDARLDDKHATSDYSASELGDRRPNTQTSTYEGKRQQADHEMPADGFLHLWCLMVRERHNFRLLGSDGRGRRPEHGAQDLFFRAHLDFLAIGQNQDLIDRSKGTRPMCDNDDDAAATADIGDGASQSTVAFIIEI